MKKINILSCLFILMFSCTTQIQNTKPTIDKKANITATQKPSISPEPSLIYTHVPKPTSEQNIDFYIETDDPYNYYEGYFYLESNKSFKFILKSNTFNYEQTNKLGNLILRKQIEPSKFSFLSLDDNLKISAEGEVEASNKMGIYRVRITYKETNKSEDVSIKVVDDISEVYQHTVYKNYGMFYGTIYNLALEPVRDVTITTKIIEELKWYPKYLNFITNEDGKFVIDKIPNTTRITIIATKKGYSTRVRAEVLKSNISDDPLANVYDFSTIYALQNEPEIQFLRINGQDVLGSSTSDVFLIGENKPKNKKPTIEELSQYKILTNIGNTALIRDINAKNVQIDMCFSEEIDKKSVEDNFRIRSQNNINKYISNFTFNKQSNNFTFEWYKDNIYEKYKFFQEVPCLRVKLNKSLMSNLNSSDEQAKYIIDFERPFKDLEGNEAIDRRYFRFTPSQINDFAVFSVKNKTSEFKIEKIETIDNKNNSDFINLTFNKDLSGILENFPDLFLINSNKIELNYNHLWFRDANEKTDINNATLFGYGNNSTFQAVYMIGRITPEDIQSNNLKVKILGVNRNPDTYAKKDIDVSLIKKVSIDKNILTIELNSSAFNAKDIIITSLGKTIEGYYTKNGILQNNNDLTVSINNQFPYNFINITENQLLDINLVKPDLVINYKDLQYSSSVSDNLGNK